LAIDSPGEVRRRPANLCRWFARSSVKGRIGGSAPARAVIGAEVLDELRRMIVPMLVGGLAHLANNTITPARAILARCR
jgi:hypothetical protein